MNKIIHYCWFGGKPLPKMAKKCIKSWKKYFPDYEIKEWNEKNFDINICPFVKEAYENKKWAFVSDYARIYALYNEGGIYFDTDLEVLKNVDHILEKGEMFLGKEDSNYIATCVIGVKEKHSKYMKEILEFYDRQEHLNTENLFYYANPVIITRLLKKYEKKVLDDGIEIIDKDIYIYPRDYFCPLSYNYSEKVYTENTCMIHYFNATWTPKGERVAVTLFRTFGMKWGRRILNIFYFFCNIKNRIKWKLGNIKNKIKLKLSIHFNMNKRVKNVENLLENQKEDYLVIHHPDWIGITNATKDTFKDYIPLREQYTQKEAQKMAEAILKKNKKLVIFNAFANGWEYIAESLRKQNKDIVIKVLLHGSHALFSEGYDWDVFTKVIDLYRKKIVNEIGFVKKSMYEFYQEKGFRTSFIMNNVFIPDKEEIIKNSEKNTDKIKVGLYSSGDRWVKNTYNQISAISLLENAILDSVPLNDKTKQLCKIFELEFTGESNNISREEMFQRMASNDINLYVTFTECAPLIPLESLELGVPCITGDNHHYFEGTELEKYLVVNKEDNIMEIYKKMKYVLENKQRILELYRDWKKEYDIKAQKSIEEFLKI